jgi:Toprim-like
MPTSHAALLTENFIWEAFHRSHQGRARASPSGFTNINCPMCIVRGHRADRRYRCGVKPSPSGVGVNCFNCGFTAGWTAGRFLSNDMKSFLAALGVSEIELASLSMRAALLRRGGVATENVVAAPSNFPVAALPPGARSIEEWANDGCTDPDFIEVAAYLFSRGDGVASSGSYHWAPDGEHGMGRRLIVPFLYGADIVGYAARAIDPGVASRYVSHKPADYLFNNSVLRLRHRRYVIVVEGVFDAIALNAVGLLGSTVSPRQAAWLRNSGQTVIVLPDRDKAGEKLIDAALQYGWRVAFPRVKGSKAWWEEDVKDAADAVKRYGRLYTLLSTIETATSDAATIAVKRRLL